MIITNPAISCKAERPGLAECMKELKKGDTLIIWRLDRLGRSLRNLIDIVEQLQKRGAESGEMIFNIFGTLAQFERRLIQERTQTGLTAARASGRKGGRPKISNDDPKVQIEKKMSISIGEICETLKILWAS